MSKELSSVGVPEARVASARMDTCSREVLRHDDLKDRVKLSRVRDHFICKSQLLRIDTYIFFTYILIMYRGQLTYKLTLFVYSFSNSI